MRIIIVLKFQDIEGSKFFIDKNFKELAANTPDKFESINRLASEAFKANVLDLGPNHVQTDDSIIEPSQILNRLIEGNKLRPQKPDGYVIDENDHVYIQNGAIWFGPIGGFQKYFSDQLGNILDCLGISWSSQRFVLTIEKGKSSPSIISTAEQFLDKFRESKIFLKRQKAKQSLWELEEQQEVIQAKIARLKEELETH